MHFLSQSKEDSEHCWGWKMLIFRNSFFVWTQMCASTCWESSCTNQFCLEKLTGLVRKRNLQPLVINLLFMLYFIYSLSVWDLGGVEKETFNIAFWSFFEIFKNGNLPVVNTPWIWKFKLKELKIGMSSV